MAKPVFNPDGTLLKTADDNFVDSILNGHNELVDKEFTGIIGLLYYESEQLDKLFLEAKKKNINVITDEGAQKDFEISYDQELNKSRAKIMGNLAERVNRVSDKLFDPQECYQPLPDSKINNVSMNDKSVKKRYDQQYQDLFKGRITGHRITKEHKLSTMAQQKQLFNKLDKDFDSSDEEDFNYY